MIALRPVLRLALVLCLVLSTQGLPLVQGTFLLRQDVTAKPVPPEGGTGFGAVTSGG